MLRSISYYLAGKSYPDKGLVAECMPGVLVDIDMVFRILFTTKDTKITKGFLRTLHCYTINLSPAAQIFKPPLP